MKTIVNTRPARPLANAIPEAARRLGISRSAIYELMKEGRLRAFKVGTRTLIAEEELVRFVADAQPATVGARRCA